MSVKKLNNSAEFKKAASQLEIIIEAPKPCIVFFTAAWCGPCRMIAPIYDRKPKEYSNVRFYLLDVDEVPDSSKEIKAVPTFTYFKGGAPVTTFMGANPAKLDMLCKQAAEGA
ncbi:thioredoxin [Ceratobasidium sp. AG-Ba]|nr:thioredoxin [Ceratobasidium sp. AG-Ba]